ncbi:MAG: NAD(P)H-dependent oxidoreductase, partial [Pseudomonadota bacterium]
MKVLAFAASNSRASINKQLVGHAINVLTQEIEPNADCELIDLNDYEMAIYSIDRQTEGGIPQLAH